MIEKMARDLFLSACESIKECEPGTPEWEFFFHQIFTYRTFIERKMTREMHDNITATHLRMQNRDN